MRTQVLAGAHGDDRWGDDRGCLLRQSRGRAGHQLFIVAPGGVLVVDVALRTRVQTPRHRLAVTHEVTQPDVPPCAEVTQGHLEPPVPNGRDDLWQGHDGRVLRRGSDLHDGGRSTDQLVRHHGIRQAGAVTVEHEANDSRSERVRSKVVHSWPSGIRTPAGSTADRVSGWS